MKSAALIVQIGDAVMMAGAAGTNGLNAVFVGNRLFALEYMEGMARNQRHDARDLGEQEQPSKARSEAAGCAQQSHSRLAWPSATVVTITSGGELVRC